MAVLGFNYTKLSAEKKGQAQGKVNISNNASLAEVTKEELGVEPNEALKINFKYVSKYNPNVAAIRIEGELLYVDEDKEAEELLDAWEEDGKLPEEVMTKVMNYILGKCNKQAILLSKEIGLPSPIRLPKITGDEQQSKKKSDSKKDSKSDKSNKKDD